MGSNKLYVFSVKSEHHIIYKSKYYVILIASLQERFRKLNGIFSVYGSSRKGCGTQLCTIHYTGISTNILTFPFFTIITIEKQINNHHNSHHNMCGKAF